MIRTKGEAGSGNIVEAVRHMRTVQSEMKRLTTLRADELMAEAKELGAPFELVAAGRRRPASCRCRTSPPAAWPRPADAALMMQLGAEAVFVGSGIFKIGKDLPPKEQRKAQLQVASAMVKTVANWDNPALIAEISTGLPKAMRGISLETLPEEQLLAKRGW